jgi:hypothetical protein
MLDASPEEGRSWLPITLLRPSSGPIEMLATTWPHSCSVVETTVGAGVGAAGEREQYGPLQGVGDFAGKWADPSWPLGIVWAWAPCCPFERNVT